MAVKKPGMSLGDAMKEAKKTYKKQKRIGGGGCGGSEPMEGGMLAGMAVPLGGKRSRTKKNRRGGSLYGFGGGNGGGNDGGLADGAGAYGGNTDMTWHAPGGSSLTGAAAGPSAPAKGGRRSRSRRRNHRRRGSSKKGTVGGKRRR